MCLVQTEMHTSQCMVGAKRTLNFEDLKEYKILNNLFLTLNMLKHINMLNIANKIYSSS